MGIDESECEARRWIRYNRERAIYSSRGWPARAMVRMRSMDLCGIRVRGQRRYFEVGRTLPHLQLRPISGEYEESLGVFKIDMWFDVILSKEEL